MPTAAAQSDRVAWSDERLVAACRGGDSDAWAALIDKYKNLIYSIPVKHGLHQEAGDIFQSVCLDLLSELPRLREPKAIAKWLIQTCYHKCLASRRRSERHVELGEEDDATQPAAAPVPEEMLAEVQREQAVRDALSSLPERCERMVRMLFYQDPPLPYDEVARQLGIATGSVGFIRGRCLTRLRKQLSKMGFE